MVLRNQTYRRASASNTCSKPPVSYVLQGKIGTKDIVLPKHSFYFSVKKRGGCYLWDRILRNKLACQDVFVRIVEESLPFFFLENRYGKEALQ